MGKIIINNTQPTDAKEKKNGQSIRVQPSQLCLSDLKSPSGISVNNTYEKKYEYGILFAENMSMVVLNGEYRITGPVEGVLVIGPHYCRCRTVAINHRVTMSPEWWSPSLPVSLAIFLFSDISSVVGRSLSYFAHEYLAARLNNPQIKQLLKE
ncbi:MAG: hypothetical protein ACO3K7_02375 [Candidatus Marinamargulisbacteria bacterium]